MPHVLTVIGSGLDPQAIAQAFLPGSVEHRVEWLEPDLAADIFLPRAPDAAQRRALADCLAGTPFDFILQPAEGREKRLLISDMDSTMIEQECIDELAGFVGLKAHVAAITERAMNGELDFKAALRERVALLKDLPESALQQAYEAHITLMPGARTLVQTMKARGAYCLLVSGGFRFFTGRVAAAIGFDAEEANQLEIAQGKLTGRVIEPILDKASKRESLHRAAAARGLPLSATLALGDGANDLPMLLDAGLGIAFHAKPAVREAAHHSVTHHDLTAALYAQGIAKKDWVLG